MRVFIKKLGAGVKEPKFAFEGDAGMDVYANEEAEIKLGERKLIGTGLQVQLPKELEIQVRPKSGLALDHGIILPNTPGTIDSTYRGEIKIIVMNLGKKPFRVEKGKKIAQLVFNRIEKPEIKFVEELEESVRGRGGFGSTGLE